MKGPQEFCSRGSALITWWQIHKNFCLTTSTLMEWWQVRKNFCYQYKEHLYHVMKGPRVFLFERPHHLMTGQHEFFVWQHPPSLHDDRSTFVPKRLTRHHMMTGPQEVLVQEGPPSSPDDRYTWIFCPTTSTLTAWWQVHKNFCSYKVVLSSRDDRSTTSFGFRGSALIVYIFCSTAYGALCVSLSSSTHAESWKSQMTWWLKFSLWEEVPLQKMITIINGGTRGKTLSMTRTVTKNIHKVSCMMVMLVSCTWLGIMWSLECQDDRSKIREIMFKSMDDIL